MTCQCGAFRLYQAGNYHPFHSSWCEEAIDHNEYKAIKSGRGLLCESVGCQGLWNQSEPILTPAYAWIRYETGLPKWFFCKDCFESIINFPEYSPVFVEKGLI